MAIGKFVLAFLSFLVLGCDSDTERAAKNPPPIPGPAGGSEYKSRLGAPATSASVWPVPSDGEKTASGIVTTVIHAGVGDRPQLGGDQVLGIALVEYDKTGRVVSHVPMKVQAIDLAPAAWKEVLLRMKKGEVRRAWIPMPNSSIVIMDFELQQHVIPTPSDYGDSR